MSRIDKIEIRNFKKFYYLTLDNLSSFNLITGDNNIGKTTLLEAIIVIQDDINISLEYLHRTLCIKNLHIHPKRINSKNPSFPSESYFSSIKNTLSEPIEFTWYEKEKSHSISFQDCTIEELTEEDFEKQKPDNYNVRNTKYWVKIFKDGKFDELQWMYLDDFKRDLKYDYWPLISFNAGFAYDVNRYYIENIGVDDETVIHSNGGVDEQIELRFKTLDFEQKKAFIDTLSLFVSDIEDTTIKNYYGRDMLAVKSKAFNDYQPVTFWGEGFNKFICYLLEIIQCQGERILIDEIDTGIHWSKLEKFWKYIIQSCKANDVQLFATTHSQECIKAFVKAGEELELEDLRLIEIEEFETKSEKKKTVSTTYDRETLKFKIETETNVRGGDVWA